MTALLSATATWMPSPASVLAPAPLALGVPAEPCASILTISAMPRVIGFGGCGGTESTIGLRGDSEGSHRFDSAASISGRDWRRYGKDRGHTEGGGPLRA